MRELVKKLRNYQIRIRKAIDNQMQGDFHSVFKGSGLEFDDVRAYQYGDDTRTIDWNVSAKGHGTFVKTFKEEKEQNIFFLLDVSASQDIGNPNARKIDIAKEICGVLFFSAVKEQSLTGLICYSDQKEKYIKPGKGEKHAYFMLSELLRLKPDSKKTNLNKALLNILNLLKRKSIIIVVSDFIDEGYEHNLKAVARKHDLIVIQINDKRETDLPKLGIVPLMDKESNRTIWVNTSFPLFRKNLQDTFARGRTDLEEYCHKINANYVNVYTHEDYILKLIKLFKIRNKGRRIA